MCNNNLHFFIFVSFYYPKQSLNRRMRPDAYALFIRKPYHTAVERVKLLGDFLPQKYTLPYLRITQKATPKHSLSYIIQIKASYVN